MFFRVTVFSVTMFQELMRLCFMPFYESVRTDSWFMIFVAIVAPGPFKKYVNSVSHASHAFEFSRSDFEFIAIVCMY